ncbi:hypothetical protein TWF694_008784 [Orbilia ellipsospora]|uniref:Uncharacterized protein n=1 Tax=Orbilia ellipsospora TaxID=2528407 RepID=A0AAV9XCY7_9PEZI
MRSSILINLLAVYAISSTAAPIGNLPAKVEASTSDIQAENIVDTAVNITQEAVAGNIDVEQVSKLLKLKVVSDLTNTNTDAQAERHTGLVLTDAELQCCIDVLKDVPTCTVSKCLEAIARTRSTTVDLRGGDTSTSILDEGVVGGIANLVNVDGLIPSLGKSSTEGEEKVKRDDEGGVVATPKPAEMVLTKTGLLQLGNLLNISDLVDRLLKDNRSVKTELVQKRQYQPARFQQLKSRFGTPFVDFIRHACEKALRVKNNAGQQKPAAHYTASSNAKKASAPRKPARVAVVKAATYNNGVKAAAKAPTAKPQTYSNPKPVRIASYSGPGPKVNIAAKTY